MTAGPPNAAAHKFEPFWFWAVCCWQEAPSERVWWVGSELGFPKLFHTRKAAHDHIHQSGLAGHFAKEADRGLRVPFPIRVKLVPLDAPRTMTEGDL
jgi:hypothetical protein